MIELYLLKGHGINRFIKDIHIIIKLVWLLLIASSYAYCFYIIINTFVEFFNFEVNVAINLVDETPAYFPAIDICNLNPYDANSIKLNENIQSSLDTLVNPDYLFIDDSESLLEPAKNFKLKADAYIRNRSNEFEYLASQKIIDINSIGFNLSNMMVSCKFQEQLCTENDFTQYHNYYYGNCYRFNGGKNEPIKKSTIPGWRYGLQLELYTGLRGTLSYTNGFRILVHNQSDLYVFPEEDGINISPGFLSNVAIEKTHLERLPSPFNDCLDNLHENKYDYLVDKSSTMKLMKNTLKIGTYDQNLCLKLCLQAYINQKCNCSDFSLISHSASPAGCHREEQVECSNKAQIEFFNSKGITYCQTDCPSKCNIYKYNTKISTSKYPTHWFIKNLYTSIILDDYTQYVAMINLYYSDMITTEITQTPLITTEMLFGNVGGQLVSIF